MVRISITDLTKTTFLPQPNSPYSNVNRMLALMGRNCDKLNDTLSEQQKETLAKYDDSVNEMHSLAEQAAFRYGFALGVRLIAESVSVELREDEE